jgi:hypothetical protein
MDLQNGEQLRVLMDREKASLLNVRFFDAFQCFSHVSFAQHGFLH